ncbi:MAG: ABC transporter permease [bacterium]
MYAFLYAPILTLVLFSFNNSDVTGLPFKGFTLQWYWRALQSQTIRAAFANSVMLGIATALIASTLALLLGAGFRSNFRGKQLVLNLILLPIIVPGIITGVMLLVLFGAAGILPSLWMTVLPAHVTWALPFAFLTIYPRLYRMDRSLEEAAMDLGAGPWTTFREVVFPQIRPGVVAACLFSFTLSFDEFVRTVFLLGMDRTLPVQFWYMIVEQLSPDLAAMAVIILLVSIAVSLTGYVVVSRAPQ